MGGNGSKLEKQLADDFPISEHLFGLENVVCLAPNSHFSVRKYLLL